jgi:hypothetical protein
MFASVGAYTCLPNAWLKASFGKNDNAATGKLISFPGSCLALAGHPARASGNLTEGKGIIFGLSPALALTSVMGFLRGLAYHTIAPSKLTIFNTPRV